MEYTVQQLANLAGVSSRTLRYYDQIGLLKPGRTSSSGYRLYGQREVDCLQHILFYRELDIGLEQIKTLLQDANMNDEDMLVQHRASLKKKRDRLDHLIETLDQTLAAKQGGSKMTNEDKFSAFKQQRVHDNERMYGTEIRHQYGDQIVDEANRKQLQLTEDQYSMMQKIEEDLKKQLQEASVASVITQDHQERIANLHKQWLQYSWPTYSPQAHVGLAQLYIEDERFKSYYDQSAKNGAQLLRDAVTHVFSST
ncbi:MerR family transcriptional regulator [Shouchella sp. 1P09AA]|uniref:MerR family transcriptional regulator n=1 Tax=unclassified Shouchella TaxID=2893065 RepID=UPI0039A3B3BB